MGSDTPSPTPNEKAAAQEHPAPVPEAHHTGSGLHTFQHHHITEYVHLPRHSHLPRGIHEDGESGRKGFTPHFFRIIARSSCVPSAMVNVLWPFVPAAIVTYAINHNHNRGSGFEKIVFGLNYVAIVPSANLLGFAGQELARKLPKVFGVMLETFLGGLVEIVLFTALIVLSGMDGRRDYTPVIQAAILGSILANLLFCMGLCFVAGGMRHVTQKFDGAVTEVGCGLLFMAAFGLAIPRAFGFSLEQDPFITQDQRTALVLQVSRIDAVILLLAFCIFVVFQMFSHHGLYSSIFEADERNDRDRQDDLEKDKLTLTECIIAIFISLALVSIHAVFLVEEIDFIIEDKAVTEMFLGLILVPLVEKFAEHLTAIDEAWDNTMNLALSHVLGATLQTALLNTSIVVLIGWGLNKDMSLDFTPFHVVIVVMAILAAGSFLRDQESNYLEGSLCVLIYILIAAAAYYYPDIPENMGEGGASGATDSGAESTSAGEHGATSSTEGGSHSTIDALLSSATASAVEGAIEKAAHMLARM